jgi:hypothetical protein
MDPDRGDQDPVPPRRLEHGDQPTGPDLRNLGQWPLPGLVEQATGPGLRDEDRGTQQGSGREEQATGPGLRDEDQGTRRGSGREEQPTGPGLRDEDQGTRRGSGREEQPTGPGLGDQGLVPPQRLVPEREIIALTPDRLNERPRAPQYRHFIRGEPRDEPMESPSRFTGRLQGRIKTESQEQRRRGVHGGFTSYSFPMDNRDLPSSSQIQRLLAIYVATGEGRGAFLAAKLSEETKGRYYGRRHSTDPSQRSSGGPSDEPSDGPSDGLSRGLSGEPSGKPSGRPSSRPPDEPSGRPFGRLERLHQSVSDPAPTQRRPSVRGRRYSNNTERASTYPPMTGDLVQTPLLLDRDPYVPGRAAHRRPSVRGHRYSNNTEQASTYPLMTGALAETPTRLDRDPDVPGLAAQAIVEDEGEHGHTDSPTNPPTGSLSLRGAGGLGYNPEEGRWDRDSPKSLHLRGGALGSESTDMNPLALDSNGIDRTPRKIQ